MTRTNARNHAIATAATTLVALALVAGCNGGSDTPKDLTNAGLKSFLRDKFEYRESEIASCMKGEGFEYFPREFDEDSVLLATGDNKSARFLEITLTVDEIKQKGFGVTTADGPKEDTHSDKNSEYTGALSHADFAAYQVALDREGKGCSEKAERAVEKKFQKRESDLQGNTETISRLVFATVEFTEITTKWSTCMTQRGWNGADFHEFDSEIREETQARLDAIAVRADSGSEDAAPVVTYPTQEFEEVRTFEIGAAVDYVECFDPVRDDYDKGTAPGLVDTRGLR